MKTAQIKLKNSFTPYPEYRDSGIGWIGKIPKEWEVDILQHLFTKVKRAGFQDEELLSVYRDRGVIIKSSRDDNHNQASEDLSTYQLVEKGDLAINKMKAWQGSVAISRYRGIVSPAYYVCTPLSKNNSDFLHYLLRSDIYIKQYERNSGGVRNNQWDLSYERFRKLEAILPDVQMQKKIAKYLNEKTALIDQIIEKKKKLIELLCEKRTAVINNAVTKGLDSNVELVYSGIDWLGKVPEGWRIEKLKYVAPLRNKKIVADKNVSNYIGLENVESGTGKFVQSETEIQPESVVNVFQKGDVLFGKLRPYLAKVFAPYSDGVSTGELLDLVPDKKKVTQKYLLYKLLSKDFIKAVDDSTYGTKMPRASWNFIGNQPVAFPVVEDQKAIVSELERKTELFDQILQKAESSIETLQEFKSALVSNVVTGKIKV